MTRMTLHDAAEAFMRGWMVTRRLSGAFESTSIDEATWLHDPTGARMGELVAIDVAPERLVSLYPRGARGAISAIYSPSNSLDETKRAFRALGWRLLRTEPMFVHRLKELRPLDPRIVRASSPEDVARVAKAANKRPERMGVEDVDDAEIRLYAANADDEVVGWVRSIRTGEDAWVASLSVREAYRRQGLGGGLMAALLHDDARLGRRASVLLASQAGALLYPRLGYERVGALMLCMPIKKKDYRGFSTSTGAECRPPRKARPPSRRRAKRKTSPPSPGR